MTEFPPTPPTPISWGQPAPQAPKASHMKRNVIVGVIVGILAIGTIGALASPNGQKGFNDGLAAGNPTSEPSATAAPTATPEPTPEPTPKPTPKPTVKPTPAPTVAPTRDWQGEIDAALAGADCAVTAPLIDELITLDDATKATFGGGYGDLLLAAIDCLGDDVSAEPTSYKVGDKVSFTDSTACEVDITPTQVKAWKSTNMFVKPAKNKRFVTVLVVVRPTAGASECEGIGYLGFGIQSTDGYTYDSEAAWRDPQLPYDSDIVAKNGKAIKGWVTFELPKTLKKGILTYGDVEWTFTVK